MSFNPTRFHAQVHFAIESLLVYFYVLSRNQALPINMAKKLSEKGVKLLSELEKGNLELEQADKKLNNLIKHLNKNLSNLEAFALYPEFDLTNEQGQVSGQVLAFQHFLNQELNIGQLTMKEEKPLFQDAILLWRNALSPRVAPKEGMRELSSLIRKSNSLLPQKHHYPFPDPSQYTTKTRV